MIDKPLVVSIRVTLWLGLDFKIHIIVYISATGAAVKATANSSQPVIREALNKTPHNP